jgi:putative transposase
VRKSRFSEEQIIAILKESEAGVETGELCRRHGITRASFYLCSAKTSSVPDVHENARVRSNGCNWYFCVPQARDRG